MTSGKMNKINKLLLIIVLLFSLPAHAAKVDASLTDVLNLFSQQQKSTVDFKEEKYTSFLEQPIVSIGQLEFIAPDKLAKYIVEPEKISNKISGDELKIKTAHETHTINLKDHPEFSAVLTSIINVLSGNHDALNNDFNISIKGPINSWQLVLVPRDSFVHGYIDSIKMQGNQNKLSKIIVTEANKDYSVTHISNHR